MMKLPNLLKFCLYIGIALITGNSAYAHGLNKRETSHLHNDSLYITYAVKPWYKYRKDGTAGREVIIYFKGIKPDRKFSLRVEGEGEIETTNVIAEKPLDSLAILLPTTIGLKETKVNISINTNKHTWVKRVIIPAKRKWTVYIYPHSHVDVGYTNLQDVVEKLHVRNIDVGIDIARKTQHYPEGAKFVWNPEATWVVSSYLKNASPEQKKSFIEAVRKGWIQIDGAHSNINTSTCSDEELLRVFKNSHEITSLTGVPITTMVQVDLPGASWGLVQAAALSGIRGFFAFPNYFDLRQKWENKPFYWKSADGKNRIFYLQATSYGYGYRAKGSIYGLGKIQAFTDEYDRLSTPHPMKNFIDPFIFNETEKLERANSPYDIYAMTWSMADNCLIDADLPDAVKQWNETYAYPKLIISGTRGILEAYEEKYKSIIPEYKGDLTEFWTEGLGSDARRVGMGRVGKENLVQAETLWSLLNKTTPAPIESFNDAWENVLLAAEHTWGYQDPRAVLAKKVEANKAAYFEKAKSLSEDLMAAALVPLKKMNTSSFAVINTLSWARKGLVKLTEAQSKAGDKVVNDRNETMISQRLSTGELVFQSETIPALGSKLYKVLPGKVSRKSGMIKAPDQIRNELISVVIDQETGNIKSLVDVKTNRQYVNPSSAFQLNSYNYLAGVKNGIPEDEPGEASNATNVTIQVKENGPLIASLLVSSAAESCNWLTREVILYRNNPFIELINTVDKVSTQKKEGIHYGFAFNVPSGIIRMDIPLGVMIPEKDKVPYSNKNWFSFQRWIDVSNEDYGVTWTAIEAPIVEFGSITGTILDGARQASVWVDKVPITQTLISWPINNHWNTNFPLEQGGIISSKYLILPHEGGYNPVVANQFGVEQHRPLMAVESDRNPIEKTLVAMDNQKVMISTLKKSEDNKAIILRLRSVSDQAEEVKLSWPSAVPKSIFTCTLDEKPIVKTSGNVTLLPHGTATFRIEI